MELDPTNAYLYTNLPPALLLQGKYKEATAEYQRLMHQDFTPLSSSFSEVFLKDFDKFERAGIILSDHREKVKEIKEMLQKEGNR